MSFQSISDLNGAIACLANWCHKISSEFFEIKMKKCETWSSLLKILAQNRLPDRAYLQHCQIVSFQSISDLNGAIASLADWGQKISCEFFEIKMKKFRKIMKHKGLVSNPYSKSAPRQEILYVPMETITNSWVSNQGQYCLFWAQLVKEIYIPCVRHC